MRVNLRSGNWKRVRAYCYRCKRWYDGIAHRDCPKSGWLRGKPGNAWIDIVNMRMGCDKCLNSWELETNTFWCEYGHKQKTSYSDKALAIGATDRIIASDGNLVYVLQRSGAVVVGRREYHGFSYR